MINDMISRQVIGQPTPVVGMGATFLVGSDRYAATIVEVIEKNGTFIIGIQHDDAKVTNGAGGTGGEEYEFTPNTNGYISYFRAKIDQKWRGVEKSEKGRWVLRDCGGLAIGYRSHYRDPSF